MLVTIILTVLAALLFIGAGMAKIGARPAMVASAEHLGLSVKAYKLIGALEVLGAIGVLAGLVWRPFGVVASVGLLLLMLGAVSFHVHAKDPAKELTPAGVAGVLSAVVLVAQLAA